MQKKSNNQCESRINAKIGTASTSDETPTPLKT